MITQNLHTHSIWDDGKNTVEEMILASRATGLKSVGMSAHSPMPFENEWECPLARLPAYIAEVRALKTKYAGEMDVYLGIEWDVTAQEIDLSPYDYVIGSVHKLPVLGGLQSVDESAETTARYLCDGFLGDADEAAEMYFAQYDKVASKPEVGIVGHFDLLTKFDEMAGPFFNPQSPRYVRAAKTAMEKLVDAGKIFEVNTGAISRGYRKTPYPSRTLLAQLRSMGGRVTVSSDAHHVSGVTCAFGDALKLVRSCGFMEIWVLEGSAFVSAAL